jgi:hypothetical protein
MMRASDISSSLQMSQAIHKSVGEGAYRFWRIAAPIPKVKAISLLP